MSEETVTTNVAPSVGTENIEPHQPTAEEMERTRKVMHDSLAGRKPKSFLEKLKEWFR